MHPALAVILSIMFSFFSKPTTDLPATIYDFRLKALDGSEIDFSKYKGKYILIVNTASKCGFTPQYADLERLSRQYSDKLVVLGFPANNFFRQEPGSNEQIAEFCTKNYGVTFQMFEKLSVKGKDKAPLYQWLAQKSQQTPSWNFCKYLFDPQGNYVAYFGSKVNPMDPAITDNLKSTGN